MIYLSIILKMDIWIISSFNIFHHILKPSHFTLNFYYNDSLNSLGYQAVENEIIKNNFPNNV